MKPPSRRICKFFKGLVADATLFIIYFAFFHYIHSVAYFYNMYIHPSPFAEASHNFSLLLVCILGKTSTEYRAD